jgi:fibronectin-binding autotransporter adhesin
MSRRYLPVITSLLFSMSAYGQTQDPVPAAPIATGVTWTPPQWLQAWGTKQDVGGSVTTSTVTGNSVTNTLATWMSYLAGIVNPNPVLLGGTLGVTGQTTLGGTLTGATGNNLTITSPSSSNIILFKNGVNGPLMFEIGGSSGLLETEAPLHLNPTTTPGNYGFNMNNIWTGTSSSPFFMNVLQAVDNTANSSGQGSSPLYVSDIVGAATATGAKNALVSNFGMTHASGNTINVGGSYSAGQFTAAVGLNDNGTALTSAEARGLLYGINPVAHLGSGSTFWTQVTADESDCATDTGASVLDFVCVQIVSLSNHAVPGARDDVMLSLNAQTGAAGVKYGLEFGRYGGAFPISSTGTLIYGQGNAGAGFSAANGIDFSLGTFSGSAFKSPGFNVGGSGNTTIGGTLGVTGKVTASGGANVSGLATFGGVGLAGLAIDAGASLVRAGWLTAYSNGGSTTWTPSATPSGSSLIAGSGNQTGTIPSSGSYAAYSFGIPSDTVAGAQGGSGGFNGMTLSHNWGGTGTTGSRTSLLLQSVQTGTLGTPNAFYDGINVWMTGNYAGNGGNMISMNPQVNLTSGATGWALAEIMEGQVQSMAPVSGRVGVQMFPGIGYQGSSYDFAYGVTGIPSGVGFLTALQLGKPGNPWGLDTANGCVICAPTSSTTMQVKYGINLSNVAFTTAALAFPGFNVDGSGNVTGAAYKVGATAGVSCSAGTVSLATLVVTSGIVTHC